MQLIDTYYQPVVVNIVKELDPKLVAMSIGWIESENMMSEMARAMMNTSVGPSFFRRKMRTKRTSRFRKLLTRTAAWVDRLVSSVSTHKD